MGVMVGDLVYTWLAVRLARRTGRSDVTAMPFGLDTPSTIGMALLVLGPAFARFRAAGLDPTAAGLQTWYLGMAATWPAGVERHRCPRQRLHHYGDDLGGVRRGDGRTPPALRGPVSGGGRHSVLLRDYSLGAPRRQCLCAPAVERRRARCRCPILRSVFFACGRLAIAVAATPTGELPRARCQARVSNPTVASRVAKSDRGQRVEKTAARSLFAVRHERGLEALQSARVETVTAGLGDRETK
jgi:hypothetical protein